jgi:hypothetical protein
MKKIIWKTFDEWSNLGYLILKGSKATVIDNKLQFNNRQIKRKPVNQFKIRTANGNLNGFWGDSFDGHWENGHSSCGEEGGYSPEMYG